MLGGSLLLRMLYNDKDKHNQLIQLLPMEALKVSSRKTKEKTKKTKQTRKT